MPENEEAGMEKEETDTPVQPESAKEKEAETPVQPEPAKGKEAPEKKKMSIEERRARQAKQDAAKQKAVAAMGRKLNAIFRLVTVLGIILAIAVFLFSDIYPSTEHNQPGYQAVKEIFMTGRAYEKLPRGEMHELRLVGLGPMIMAILPLMLVVLLLAYLIDWIKPLGRSPHIISATVAIGAAVFITYLSKTNMWPGVHGMPMALEILALFVLSVGAILDTPGSGKRLLENSGAEIQQAKESVESGETAEKMPAGAEKTSDVSQDTDDSTADENSEETTGSPDKEQEEEGENSGDEESEEKTG